MMVVIWVCKLNCMYEMECLVDVEGLDVDARDETSDE